MRSRDATCLSPQGTPASGHRGPEWHGDRATDDVPVLAMQALAPQRLGFLRPSSCHAGKSARWIETPQNGGCAVEAPANVVLSASHQCDPLTAVRGAWMCVGVTL